MGSEGRNRREFIAGLGAGMAAVAAGMAAGPGHAQATGGGPSLPKVVDFHNHFVGSAFTSIAGAAAPAADKARWQAVNRNLTDPQALLASIEAAGIDARVINTPLEFIQDPDADAPPDMTARINDQLAELVGKHPGRLYALATVDAFSGERGARELTRAIRELGLRGVFVQSAKNDLFLDAPEVRPTLHAAAELGVPVFVHPISDSQLRTRFGRFGRRGTSLNRSTINPPPWSRSSRAACSRSCPR